MSSGPIGLLHTGNESPHSYIESAKNDIDLINSILVSDKSRLNNDIRGQVINTTTSLLSNVGHASIALASLQTENVQLRMEILELRNQLNTLFSSNKIIATENNERTSDLSDKILKSKLTDYHTNKVNMDRTVSTHGIALAADSYAAKVSNAVQVRTKPNRRPIISGQGTCDPDLKTVERKRFIHAFSFDPETSEEQILSYMKRKDPDIVVKVEKIVTKGDYASFKIAVPASRTDNWLKPEMWPLNASINEWTFRRSPRPTAIIPKDQ